MLVFNSELVSHEVCIYIKYIFGVMRNILHWTTASETSNTKYLEIIKRRSKRQEKNMGTYFKC